MFRFPGEPRALAREDVPVPRQFGWPLSAVLLFAVFSPLTLHGQENDETQVREALESAARLLREGQPAEAINALTVIDALEPDNPWLWYYRGLAHRNLGNLYETLEAYDHALDTLSNLGDPDPLLSDRLRRDRREVRRRLFRLSFNMGLAYDSNVTFSDVDSSASLISGRGDGKFAARLQVDHVPIINEQEAVTVGASLSHAWHFRIREFDYQEYSLYARYTRRLSDDWTLDLQYDYDITYLGNDSFLSRHRLSPRLTYHWPTKEGRVRPVATQFDYRIEARDFLFDTAPPFDRDGFANSVGLAHHVVIQPLSDRGRSWNVHGGYRLESAATEGSEFDRITSYFHLGVDFSLADPLGSDRDVTCRMLAQWEMAHYRNHSLIDRPGRHRQDLITTLGVVFSRTLVEDVQHGDLILHGIFNWTDSDSNIIARDLSEPFTYDKTVAGFQLEWRF